MIIESKVEKNRQQRVLQRHVGRVSSAETTMIAVEPPDAARDGRDIISGTQASVGTESCI